ncbi:hypothetical protein QQX98_000741 [Neonectria punicea]|uniref:Nephrocystin 3-like N-terminal domain-containing protein n=1 Tax=Neonectria punicea TaxID=979145 RepID=A0ABR1HRL8_9HYPO
MNVTALVEEYRHSPPRYILIIFCSKVASVCYEYRNALKDAPRDIARILDEVANVRNIAERQIKIAEVDRAASLESVDGPYSPLQKFPSELVDLKASLNLHKKPGLKSTLMWPLKQGDVEKDLHNIVEVLNNTRSLPIIQEKVARISEHIETKTEDDFRDEIIAWLDRDNQAYKHRDEYKKCVQGTGDWLLQNDAHVRWKAEPGNLLWLNGNAGCGKTVLCANIIENLQTERQDDDNIGLAYFYIDGAGLTTLDAEGLCRSLISQLVTQKGSCRGNNIPMGEWEGILQASIQEFSSVYIVLDALDESEESIGTEAMMDFINVIFGRVKDQVHIITFSQKLESLQNMFKELRATSIAISDHDLDHDLKTALRLKSTLGCMDGSAIAATSAKGHAEVTIPLFLAVNHGHLEVVELLLEHGARDVFQMKATPRSALQAAAISGRLDIVKAMLKHQRVLDTNTWTCNGVIRPAESGISASQHAAAAVGHIDILRELLEYGISKEETLRYAAMAGDKALVIETLDQGISINAPGTTSDHPVALQSAAKGGHVDIVQELLSRGADPNDDSGYSSPLLKAMSGGKVEIVQMIINAGADLNPTWPHPIDSAAAEDRADMIHILVQNGTEQPDDHTHILQAAARGGSEAIVRYMLSSGMKAEPITEDGHTSPLMEALRSEHWKVTGLLLDNGANVNAPPPAHLDNPAPAGYTCYNGHPWPPAPADETPLTTALAKQNQEIARTLLSLGASVTPDTPETTGTPLLYAVWGKTPAWEGNFEIVNQLIHAGAKVDDQDVEGFSPLHIAAAGKDAKILRVLIEDRHATISPALVNGSQPVHSAASRGTAEHVKILLDNGAPVNTRNKDGRTPLHWAANGSCWDSVELLLDQGADASTRSDESSPDTALDLAHLAEKPQRQKRKDIVEAWNEERVEKLLQRLKEAMVG